MNNFFKYPSGSEIDVAAMFTKDNLVSIKGLRVGDNANFTELAVLNKDNNFTNIDQPTKRPSNFEIVFKDISISMDTHSENNETIINRNIFIMRSGDNDGDYNVYVFNLITIANGKPIAEEIGRYYTNS